MNNRELITRCEVFRRTLERASNEFNRVPLDEYYVRRFNEFVAEHPNMVEWEDERGRTLLDALYRYLIHAIEQGFPLETMLDLVVQTPQVLAEKNVCGWTLLHFVCDWNPTASDIISFFVNQNPDAAGAFDIGKRTPLHYAFKPEAPSLPVARVLVEAYPRALEICDSVGDAPLHCACYFGAPLDVIHYLVIQKPHICLRRNRFGDVPLDRAKCRDSADHNVVEFMTNATNLAARVLMKRLCFRGSAPREIFDQVVAYLDGGPVVGASGVNLALDAGDVAVLFRRNDIQEVCRDQIIEILGSSP